MRILYLHQYFVPPQAHGKTRTYELARRLIDKGHDVTVLTTPGEMPDKYKTIKQVTYLTMEGVPVIILPVQYSQSMSYPRRMWAFVVGAWLMTLVAMRHKVDVIYATSGPLTIAIPALIAKWVQHIPMVFEVRDLWPDLPIAIGAIKHPWMILLARRLERIAYHGAAHVVALSPGMKAGVLRQGVSADKVTVIPNSCDLDLFDVSVEQGLQFRKRLGLSPSQPLITYAGSFGYMNRVEYLVEVALEMRHLDPTVHFLLVGFGANKQKVEEYARQRGVLDVNLTVMSSVAKEDMPSVLSATTVSTSLFLPIQEMWNNSANKFFDALAAGRPIAINYGGWQADLLEKHQVGIRLADTNPSLGAHQLARFLGDVDGLQAARHNAHQLARTEFHRDVTANQLETVLRQAIELQ